MEMTLKLNVTSDSIWIHQMQTLVFQEMLVKEMFYCFSPVTLFFFIMNSQIYHFNSVGEAVVSREIFKGTNTFQSQS